MKAPEPNDEIYYPELKEKFKTDRGVGTIVRDDEGNVYEALAARKPIVRFRISTFRGMCFDAVHYYGSLSVGDLALKCIKAKGEYAEVGSVMYHGGAFDRFKPKEIKDIKIELQRILTKGDLRTKVFKDYRHFDNPSCNRFDRKEDVIKEGQRIFDKFFGEGWTLEVDDQCE